MSFGSVHAQKPTNPDVNIMDKGKIIDCVSFLQSSTIILATTIVFYKEFFTAIQNYFGNVNDNASQ